MRKTLLLLAVGVAFGYWLGFRDAQMNEQDIVSRIVSGVGGETRASIRNSNNTDRLLDSVSR